MISPSAYSVSYPDIPATCFARYIASANVTASLPLISPVFGNPGVDTSNSMQTLVLQFPNTSLALTCRSYAPSAVPSVAFVVTEYTSVSPIRVISCASSPPIADRFTVTLPTVHLHPSMTVTFSWVVSVPLTIDVGFAFAFSTAGASSSTAVRSSGRD